MSKLHINFFSSKTYSEPYLFISIYRYDIVKKWGLILLYISLISMQSMRNVNGGTISTDTLQTVDGTFYNYIFESPQYRNGKITVKEGSILKFDIGLVIKIPYDLHPDHRFTNLTISILFSNNRGINLVESFTTDVVYTYERINVHAPHFNGSIEIDNRFPSEFEVSIGSKFKEGVASVEDLSFNNDQWVLIANANIESDTSNYTVVIILIVLILVIAVLIFIKGVQKEKKPLKQSKQSEDDKMPPKDPSITKDHRKLI